MFDVLVIAHRYIVTYSNLRLCNEIKILVRKGWFLKISIFIGFPLNYFHLLSVRQVFFKFEFVHSKLLLSVSQVSNTL